MRVCWCGNEDLTPFGPMYGQCHNCETLVNLNDMPAEHLMVSDDERGFYGKKYWLEHQQAAYGYDDIHVRARKDLIERNLHWLKTLLKYRLPPGRALEIGCTHGSFVALLRQAGYDASGIELSPWVVEFGQRTFDVPISVGPVETLKIPAGSLDVIAMMDVMEHLHDPVATMSHCLRLLKPEGLLLIQTPQFKRGTEYTDLIETDAAFLEQLKADEHLYLFSDLSATRLFQQLGAENIQFEDAIFGHYDMFFVVSQLPFSTHSTKEIEAALTSSSNGRLALALLDIYARESVTLAQLKADKAQLVSQLESSEVDRAARLEVIETQGKQLERIAQLEADKAQLISQLEASEVDRAAQFEVIETQGKQLERIVQLEADKAQLVSQLESSEVDRAARLEVIETQGKQLERIAQLEADKAQLISQLEASEADRAARLEVIETQGKQLERIAQLEADKAQLVSQLEASEADRAARLEVIETQGKQLERIVQLEADKAQLVSQLEASEADRASLGANWLVRTGIKAGLVPMNRK
ncbi:hypothetical protein DSCA_09970 [Desulfosarcina alkanivorans]|uniref:Methyltransferase type 11 domain-containing protein n=1 Tax=Desulfosarcina alkanivorans TaxID=571177 RepID=A0A5K7YR11_9BACT|nr:methyltransferase domain-containing protein [Desulfosarcina alkanivorans]BBO67067.1 hypothetical protein DSCA_09970 [Desulfosarcina alkanivorans]